MGGKVEVFVLSHLVNQVPSTKVGPFEAIPPRLAELGEVTLPWLVGAEGLLGGVRPADLMAIHPSPPDTGVEVAVHTPPVPKPEDPQGPPSPDADGTAKAETFLVELAPAHKGQGELTDGLVERGDGVRVEDHVAVNGHEETRRRSVVDGLIEGHRHRGHVMDVDAAVGATKLPVEGRDALGEGVLYAGEEDDGYVVHSYSR